MEKRMPRCLGAYEADDPQCDGNPVGKTDHDRAPCVYRDRCSAFIKLMDLTGRPRDYFVREGEEPGPGAKPVKYAFANQGDFDLLLNEQIDAYGITAGRITVRVPKKIKPPVKSSRPRPTAAGKPSKATQRAGAKARSKQFGAGRDKAQEVAQWYMRKLAERLKRKVALFDEAARPGDLYLVDKLESAGYCAVYCKGKGRKHAVCSFFYKSLTGKLEIRLACSFEHYAKAVPKADQATLKPIDHTGKDGAFKVRFKEVDAGRAAMIATSAAQVFRRFDPGFPEVKGEE